MIDRAHLLHVRFQLGYENLSCYITLNAYRFYERVIVFYFASFRTLTEWVYTPIDYFSLQVYTITVYVERARLYIYACSVSVL